MKLPLFICDCCATGLLLLLLTLGCHKVPQHDCYMDDGLDKLKTAVDVVKHVKMHLTSDEVKEVDISLEAYAPNYDKFVEWYVRIYYPAHCPMMKQVAYNQGTRRLSVEMFELLSKM